MTFEEFVQAKRAREKAAAPKVTWRRVSPDTGGGWSGLGPNRQLVYVRVKFRLPKMTVWEFGRVVDGQRAEPEHEVYSLREAKQRAAALLG